jgi:hypothetical protein
LGLTFILGPDRAYIELAIRIIYKSSALGSSLDNNDQETGKDSYWAIFEGAELNLTELNFIQKGKKNQAGFFKDV